jgi:hypothetical protein
MLQVQVSPYIAQLYLFCVIADEYRTQRPESLTGEILSDVEDKEPELLEEEEILSPASGSLDSILYLKPLNIPPVVIDAKTSPSDLDLYSQDFDSTYSRLKKSVLVANLKAIVKSNSPNEGKEVFEAMKDIRRTEAMKSGRNVKSLDVTKEQLAKWVMVKLWGMQDPKELKEQWNDWEKKEMDRQKEGVEITESSSTMHLKEPCSKI